MTTGVKQSLISRNSLGGHIVVRDSAWRVILYLWYPLLVHTNTAYRFYKGSRYFGALFMAEQFYASEACNIAANPQSGCLCGGDFQVLKCVAVIYFNTCNKYFVFSRINPMVFCSIRTGCSWIEFASYLLGLVCPG